MMTTSCHTVNFAGTEIFFNLLRANRKTLGITVKSSGEVIVRAPADAMLNDICSRVRKRAGWIIAQQTRAQRFRPRTPPRTYAEGETHLHLGRQYRLAVHLDVKQGVRIEGDWIVLAMHRPNRIEEREALLRSWRLTEARRLYRNRIARILPNFAGHGIKSPRLIVRDLTHRWGSLTRAGNLILSRDLIRAPQPCIDYVIVHELCHVIHADHGEGFYRTLGEIMPDHASRKSRLEHALL